MNICFDLQSIQTEGSRNRGIGRYSLNLNNGIIRNNSCHNIVIQLSNLYPEYREQIENNEILRTEKTTIEYNELIDSSIYSTQEEKDAIFKLNSTLLKRQYNLHNPDIIHIHSIFEEIVPENLNSLYGPLKSATLYDLIPLIYKNNYLSNEYARSCYFKNLHLYYEMDLILSISESARQDAINYLGLPPDKIVNISGAISGEFYKILELDKSNSGSILNQFGIEGKYILYTGGMDFRKNIESAIVAFSKINSKLLKKYQLVIVCAIKHDEKIRLDCIVKKCGLNKSKVTFTGFVPDNTLNVLYNLCDLFIFPSLYEGFGLPVLEAMSCGAAVIAANTSSIPEIIPREDCLFDPKDIKDITKKIDDVLLSNDFKQDLKGYSYEKSKEFSWDKSAQKALEAFEGVTKNNKIKRKELINAITPRKRIAYFSPMPGIKSGIADYSNKLIPFISNYFDIDLYVDDYEITSDVITNNYSVYNYTQFETNSDCYDEIIYHVGNSSYHEYMYSVMLEHPGIVVLHDFFVSELLNYMSIVNDNYDEYFNSIRYSHGKIGEEYLEKYINREISLLDLINALPANKKIIEKAKGIIVHSQHSCDLFLQYYPELSNICIEKVKFFANCPDQITDRDKINAKIDLELDPNSVLICTFGFIAKTKLNDYIVKCLTDFNCCSDKNIKIVFVGELLQDDYADTLLKAIDDSKIKNKITITGYVTPELYNKYLVAADIAFCLRTDSRGETSASLINLLTYGVPTIVSNYGSFKEIPDDVVLKVENDSPEQLKSKFIELLKNNILRADLSIKAYNFVKEHHNVELIAQDYAIAINKIMNHSDEHKLSGIISDIAELVKDIECSESIITKVATVLKEKLC